MLLIVSPHSPLHFSCCTWLMSQLFPLCLAPVFFHPPVWCLIIEVSEYLLGTPRYFFIKASVYVCLFISVFYSRRSCGALKKHKALVSAEACTVSCHCTSTYSKPSIKRFSVLLLLKCMHLWICLSTLFKYT